MGFFLAKMCNNLKMTERQKEIMEAYLLEVGEDVVTKKDAAHWFKWMCPVRRDDEKKLSRDTEPFKGIVLKFASSMLPAPEYRY